jgi:NAD dependent epimerase/dehydratase
LRLSDWNKKRVLVTGAGGFIGSHLAERLVQEGAEVRALVHYNAFGRRGWLDRSPQLEEMQVIAGDLTDRDSVRQAVKDRDILFHLGALIAIPYSYQAPLSYIHTNIEGTLNVLQAGREEGVKRIVHTSTSEVYGSAQYVPIDEKHPLKGQSPYAASKIGADKIAEAFHLSFNTPVTTVRPFNTFGPRQSMRAIIPTIIVQCLRGNIVHLGNLHPTRDLNFVANTVDGFLLAASEPAALGQTVNLGSRREISVGDLASLIAKMVGKPIKIESEDERLRPAGSEVERLLAENALAGKLFGWTPKVSLEEGLNLTIAWIRDNLEMYPAGGYVY